MVMMKLYYISLISIAYIHFKNWYILHIIKMLISGKVKSILNLLIILLGFLPLLCIYFYLLT